MLGGVCAALVEGAEVLVLLNDRRRARRAPYEGLSEEELVALQNDDSALNDES
jgi:hypothetical protein